ncbi:hypothetical protein QH639_14925 [Lysinibacillus sp. 1 U-2021]|uniref:hypothetical protein n=1 Tax=Lysinibacillus sp. 1 U-2021 TaxID=3039426 RepID=UPI0024804CB1|nr:hypothetical protein [Lysinibacillus sp. 1 U-2021]WGT37139.1 hypothetical protein QH639_14925 [Lysinibacillus sp. 1 U-2021]
MTKKGVNLMILDTYIESYLTTLKSIYPSYEDFKEETIIAKINTRYLNAKEVKTTLATEVAKHFNISKNEANKILVVEE